jgi:Carboxypeptidase regulatory-like domain/Ankyrin repeats (3 copies)
MSAEKLLDSVRVKEPCSEKWDQMEGTGNIRYCSHCSKDIKNLSALTRKQALRLVLESNGRLCVRYVEHPVTRRPVFADQLIQIKQRAPQVAAGVISASIALSSHTYSQQPAETPIQVAPANIAQSVARSAKTGERKISGFAADPHGSVIVGAEVSIASVAAGFSASGKTDENGAFSFENLPIGKYRIEVESGGFDKGTGEIQLRESDVHTVITLAISVSENVTIRGGDDIRGSSTVGVIAMTVTRFYSPLEASVATGNIDQARLLMVGGVNVNLKQKTTGITPIFMAVEQGNIEMVELLLTFRAKINTKDSAKQTPIMSLDEDASPELARLLIRYGAKLNVSDSDGYTPLIRTAGKVKRDVLEILIRSGAEVNAASKSGQTALMQAAENDDLESVKLLLEAGARVNAKNKAGETAWDLASDDKVEKLIETYGGISGDPEMEEETPPHR